MKLSLVFDENDRHTVEWDKDLSDFPNVVKYDGKYWQWGMWDDDQFGLVHKVLYFGKMKEEALPMDMFGFVMPVPDLHEMFNIKKYLEPCGCGAKFSSFPNHHMIKCPRWSKE
jgi:hypothetical protein